MWAAPAALTLLAAALRFPTLGDQSMWVDEARTALIVERPGLGEMLHAFGTQSTPPLYHLVLWAWAKLAGSGDYSLRVVPALAGTATVPVTYLAGVRVGGRRAALIAAAMVATSPYLVYYSQENRPYSALALAGAGTLLLFLRAREKRSPGTIAAWGVAAIAGLALHYFAAFFLLPQAVLLLRAATDRRRLLLRLAPAAGLALGLAALAVVQLNRGTTTWIVAQPLDDRLQATFHQFIKGGSAIPGDGLGLAAAVLVALGMLLLARADSDQRRSALLPLGLAAAGVALPLAFVPLGVDVFYERNVIGAWPLLALGVAVGFGSRRAARTGPMAAVALCAVWAATTLVLQDSIPHRREDWRGAAKFIGRSFRPRVVAVSPRWAAAPLLRYGAGLLQTAPPGTRVSEVAVVATPPPPKGWPTAVPGMPGFRRSATWNGGRIAAAIYRAAAPQPVPPLPQEGLYLDPGDPK